MIDLSELNTKAIGAIGAAGVLASVGAAYKTITDSASLVELAHLALGHGTIAGQQDAATLVAALIGILVGTALAYVGRPATIAGPPAPPAPPPDVPTAAIGQHLDIAA